MGIQKRMRRWALLTVFVSLVAAAAVPGSAFALACANTTGSGSTLQTSIQQEVWTVKAKNASFFSKKACNVPTIEYNLKGGVTNGTGSGRGLEEFGMPGGVLTPKLSANEVKLDGFIDTDDPPTLAQLGEGSKAAESQLLTVATVAAPIAVIMHPPAACHISATKFIVTNSALDRQWLSQLKTWSEFLTALGISFSGTCTAAIIHEVRSDGSGTSFAFKQYLSHIQETPWTKFVKDNPEWPTETEAKTEHAEAGTKVPNKGSKGEALAVFNTDGSEGYVNQADASANGFKAWTGSTKTFWGEVQNNGTKTTGVTSAEPIGTVNGSGKTPGNCPSALAPFGVVPVGIPPVWEVQLGGPIVEAGKYSLCTLTYDVFYRSYKTPALKTAYGGAAIAEEVGNSMKTYCEWMVSEAGQEQTETDISDYSKVPAVVDSKGKALCALIEP